MSALISHSHVDETTGLDPNVLVGLKAAAAKKNSDAFNLMYTLAFRAKLTPDLATQPTTLAGCCGKKYVLRYIFQERRWADPFFRESST